MTRCALVALCLLCGCASAEDANAGGERDLAAPADAGDDLAAETPDDLARGGVGDGGLMVPPITCGGARHVVINELKTTGAPSVAGDEFVELYNPCVTPIDLNGSSLVYRSAAGMSDVLILQLNQPIAAGGYYLVAGPNYSNGGTPDQTYGAGKFLDTGGGVGLRDAAQTLIDSVGYGNATNAFVEGAPAPAPPAGDSIARTPNGTDTDHNNSDFVAATTPTPRAAN